MLKVENKKNLWFLSIVALCLFIGPMSTASAQGLIPNISSMFENSINTWISLAKLMKVLATLIGFFLVISAIFKLANIGSDPRATVKGPIVTFLVGISLYVMSASLSVTLETLALGDGPGAIFKSSGGGSAGQMSAQGIYGVLLFIRLLGYIAFIRGWLMINQYANSDGRQAGLGKGVTHILGGAAAINVQVTAAVLVSTFAPGMSIPGITQ